MFNGNVRVRPGSNRWPQDLQSYALPLSYAPNAMFLHELVTMYLVLILKNGAFAYITVPCVVSRSQTNTHSDC